MLAEVGDKEPNLWFLAYATTSCAILIIMAGWRRRWPAFVALPFVLAVLTCDVRGSYLSATPYRAALLAEMGVGYVVTKTCTVFVPLLTGCLVVLWWPRAALTRQRRVDRCYCGYDLTGNTSGLCPECGTRIFAASLDPGN